MARPYQTRKLTLRHAAHKSNKEDVIIALLREVMGKVEASVEAIIQQRERIKRETAAGGQDSGVITVRGSVNGLRLLRLERALGRRYVHGLRFIKDLLRHKVTKADYSA